MDGIAPNGQLDSPALLSENALHQRDIRFRNGSLAKSFAQLGVRRVVLGDKDHPRGFLVQPMYDSRPQRIAGLRKRLPAPKKRVDECARNIAGAGVNGHASGLVDVDNVVVFEKHIERNRFRFGASRRPRMIKKFGERRGGVWNSAGWEAPMPQFNTSVTALPESREGLCSSPGES